MIEITFSWLFYPKIEFKESKNSIIVPSSDTANWALQFSVKASTDEPKNWLPQNTEIRDLFPLT